MKTACSEIDHHCTIDESGHLYDCDFAERCPVPLTKTRVFVNVIKKDCIFFDSLGFICTNKFAWPENQKVENENSM